MKIKSIGIKNVKGIKDIDFSFDLIPNKPNIFVAPNGFGKSSFSIAFDSLRKNRIELNPIHYHQNDEANRPVITMIIEDEAGQRLLIADDTQNTINDEFDIFVINSKLLARATKLNIQGNIIAKSSLEIASVVLVPTIPQKVKFSYRAAVVKKNFGANGKILPNISSVLTCASLLKDITRSVDFRKFKQVKISRLLDSIKAEINSRNGTVDDKKTGLKQIKKVN